ncbi:MAG: guanylate kinase [Candidatus Marinimicrobia bacterium]|nr:guanylate kinase [Candidatus Neomarinimicrobiota bacterium]|tara:strand:- start:3835 stop:4416 length:582 start_codon:yes stop_codon:yes gene_type:complete
MKKGYLVVLSAPSGTGKTSICKELLKRNKKWKFSISATTRGRRSDEKDGVDYFFMSKEKFNHQLKFGEFLESEWVHGYQYGTLIAPVEEFLDNNEIVILDVDVKGGYNIKDEFEDSVISIFIEPPGENVSDQLLVLEERLTKRGNENSTLIKQRLRRFESEMNFKKRFDHHFINDNFDKVVDRIEKTIKEIIK